MTTRWGAWAFYPAELILLHEKEDYDIDLAACTTSAAVLDWIAQVEGKVWATPSDVGYLVAAICDLLNPQANLCSFGEPTTIESGEQLRELVLGNERKLELSPQRFGGRVRPLDEGGRARVGSAPGLRATNTTGG
jgi:hypothetical protein